MARILAGTVVVVSRLLLVVAELLLLLAQFPHRGVLVVVELQLFLA
jgi:hypothetical protein